MAPLAAEDDTGPLLGLPFVHSRLLIGAPDRDLRWRWRPSPRFGRLQFVSFYLCNVVQEASKLYKWYANSSFKLNSLRE
jgi:hypothetical protein